MGHLPELRVGPTPSKLEIYPPMVGFLVIKKKKKIGFEFWIWGASIDALPEILKLGLGFTLYMLPSYGQVVWIRLNPNFSQ